MYFYYLQFILQCIDFKSLSKKKKKNFPEKSTGEFYKMSKEKIIPNYPQGYSRKLKRKDYFSLHKDIVLTPKPDKYKTRKGSYRPVSLINIETEKVTRF